MSLRLVLVIGFTSVLTLGVAIYSQTKPIVRPIAGQDLSQLQDAPNTGKAPPLRGQNLDRRRAYLSAFLTQMSFWGKVVDDKGEPVPGATVQLQANSNPDPMGGGTTYIRDTDEQGRFLIVGARGITLTVEVSKAGYYSTEQSRGTANYVLNSKTALPIPTADAPAVFVLRRMGVPVPLIRVAPRPVRLPKNGTPVDISLRTGQAGGADRLRVECWTEDQNKDTQGQYSWRCRISVPGGGLAERTDQYDFEAPTNGYQSTQEIAMTASAPKWRKGVDKNYFAKLPGNNYARFVFKLTTGGEHFFVIESYLNPEPGNRNLEHDPIGNVAPSG